MRLNAPKFITWLIALIIGVAGILGHLGILKLAFLVGHGFWMVVVGFGLLVLATFFKNL